MCVQKVFFQIKIEKNPKHFETKPEYFRVFFKIKFEKTQIFSGFFKIKFEKNPNIFGFFQNKI